MDTIGKVHMAALAYKLSPPLILSNATSEWVESQESSSAFVLFAFLSHLKVCVSPPIAF